MRKVMGERRCDSRCTNVSAVAEVMPTDSRSRPAAACSRAAYARFPVRSSQVMASEEFLKASTPRRATPVSRARSATDEWTKVSVRRPLDRGVPVRGSH